MLSKYSGYSSHVNITLDSTDTGAFPSLLKVSEDSAASDRRNSQHKGSEEGINRRSDKKASVAAAEYKQGGQQETGSES